MAEGAPLLREYVGKTCIEGSNPSGSAKTRPVRSCARACGIARLHCTSIDLRPQLPAHKFDSARLTLRIFREHNLEACADICADAESVRVDRARAAPWCDPARLDFMGAPTPQYRHRA